MQRHFLLSTLRLLLAPIAPFYTLKHANRIPLVASLFFALLCLIITAPCIRFASTYDQYSKLYEVKEIFTHYILSFLKPDPSIYIPPFIFLILFYLLISPLAALFLSPRAASPRQKLRTAFKHSFHRFTIITPTICILAIIFTFSIKFPSFYENITLENYMQQWQEQNPHPREQLITQNPNGIIHYDDAYHKADLEWTNKRTATWRGFYKSTIYKRVFTLGNFTSINTCILTNLLLLMLLRAFATQKRLNYKLQSHWPATCENCNYQIFSQSANKQNQPATLTTQAQTSPTTTTISPPATHTTCPECGFSLTPSLNPIHRIDDPYSRATTLKQKVIAPLKLIGLFLFKPTTLAHQLQVHSPTSKHHQLARLMLWLIIPLTFLCQLLYSWAYHTNFGFLLINNGPYGFYNYYLYDSYLNTVLAILIAYVMTQLIALFSALTQSLILKKPNPHFALKLANIATPAMLATAFIIFLINLFFARMYYRFPTTVIESLPTFMQDDQSFAITTILLSSLIAFLIIANNIFRILNKTRFSNI